jgi:aryl sulfotransferase
MSGIYWLASYPKSGNTWFRTFLSNFHSNGEQPVVINELDSDIIASARAWLDDVLGFDTADLSDAEIERLRPSVYDWGSQDAEVGYHKIHDAYTYTPTGEPLVGRESIRGAVYILRNPLDVASSAANHWHKSVDASIQRMNAQTHLSQMRRKGLHAQVPQQLLSWSQHVLSWVDAPGLNVKVIRYEDMLNDALNTFRSAIQFLQLPDDIARIQKAIRFSDFKELARQEAEKGFGEKPPKAEKFFRKGQSGAWREELTPEQVERIIADHAEVMQRFGYLDASGKPV